MIDEVIVRLLLSLRMTCPKFNHALKEMTLTNAHLLGSIAISGILAPNLYLNLKRSYYGDRESRPGFPEVSIPTLRATVPSACASDDSVSTVSCLEEVEECTSPGMVNAGIEGDIQVAEGDCAAQVDV